MKLIFFILFSSITSCGTSFHNKRYRQGYLYGQKKNVQTHEQFEEYSILLNDGIASSENNTSVKIEEDIFLYEAEDNHTLAHKLVDKEDVASENQNDKIRFLVESKVKLPSKLGYLHREDNEKTGKKLMFAGGLTLLYLPIVGVLAAAAISSSAILLSQIFVLLFVLFFIGVIVLMKIAKQFVKDTHRNSIRKIVLITNIVLGAVSLLFLLYHMISII